MPDTQITELAGRHYLIAQLIAGGVEVALPVRDRGVDLIAYLERGEQTGKFLACPIQMKANEERRFGLLRKYEKIHGLLLAYVWHVSSSAPQVYATTYTQAHDLLAAQGHTTTKSWLESGAYSLIANAGWEERLAPYKMTPDLWGPKIREACDARSSSVLNGSTLPFTTPMGNAEAEDDRDAY